MRNCHITVLLTFLTGYAAPVCAEDYQLYFGLLHGHTSFSDGSGTPDDAFQMAKDAGLDFFAVTEHNHSQAAGRDGVFLTPQLYHELKQSARRHTADGEFVALYGQEVSTISAGNHFNVFWADELCDVRAGDFKAVYEVWLPDHREVPFIQFNHPDVREDQNPRTRASQRNNDYGIDDYDQDFEKLVQAGGRYAALIELIVGPAFSETTDRLHQNGIHQKDYLFYLNKGFRLAPSCGQDNHNHTWGNATHARMGVWARTLSEDGLNEAILNRRCYASEDDNLAIRFTVNDAVMGSTATVDDSGAARIRVSLSDPDEPEATYRVRLFYDDAIGGEEAEEIENVRFEDEQAEIEFTHIPRPGGYYFAKVTQSSDHNDDAWTAPVWIDGNGAVPLLAAVNTDDPQKEEIRWDEATNYLGQTVTVSGRIVRTFNYRDRFVFLNFDPDYENTLTLIVFRDDFEKFGGAEALQERLMNRNVRVRGTIELYQHERLQLRLDDAEQLLSAEEPETPAEEE